MNWPRPRARLRRGRGPQGRRGTLTKTITTVNTEATAHAVVLAAAGARRRRLRQGLGAFDAERRAHLVIGLALRTGQFLRDPLPFQVLLDLLGREVTVV